MRNVLALSIVAPLFALACSAPDSALTPTSGRVAQSQSSAALAAPGNPAGVLAQGGTFWFVFDESPTVVSAVQAGCAKDAAAADKVAACVDGVRKEGAREAIRFTGSDPSALTWTSFGLDDGGHEELYLELPFAVASTDGPFVRVRATGPARGKQAEQMKTIDSPSFEVVDATTIAMTDPHKGRLVFRAH